MEDLVNITTDNTAITTHDILNSTDTVITDNTTSLNGFYIGGIFFNIISFALFVVESMSIYVLGKCVLITDQIKLISQNLLMSDMCFHALSVIWFVLISPLEGNSSMGWLSTRIRIGAVYMMLLVYCLMMFVAAFDRFISIKNPLQYERQFPPSTMKRAIHTIWIVTIGAMFIPYVCGMSVYCNQGLCDETYKPLPFNQYVRMMLSVIFLSCDICIAAFYAYVLNQSGEHAAKLNRVFPTSRANRRLPGRRIMVIVAAFIVLYSPAIIYTVLYDLLQIEMSIVVLGVFYVVGFRVCTSIHSCISLYFFMYSMPECRMRFMATYLAWSKRVTRKTGQMKVEIFNIPTYQKHNSGDSFV